MQHYSLSPSQLADKLNIQRSNVSHFTSGRNYPSFEVLQRILSAFPELEITWLIQGTGNMIKNRTQPPSSPKNELIFGSNIGSTGLPTVRPQATKPALPTPAQPDAAPTTSYRQNDAQNAPQTQPPATNAEPAVHYGKHNNPINTQPNIGNIPVLPTPNIANMLPNNGKKAVKIAIFYDDNSFDFFGLNGQFVNLT
jgi:transcriptional regulator with XRE-family HTH domain